MSERDRIPYVSLLAAVHEVNRCPGGKHTVRRIAQRLNIGRDTRVLEVGSNTGFTSFELVKLTGCRTVGVDIDPNAVQESVRVAETLGSEIADRVEFRVADAAALPFEDDAFDVIVCGGANSFVQDRAGAFAEYRRTLRRYGFLSITNLFYHSPPPDRLMDDLADVLGFRLPPRGLDEWLTELAPKDWEFYDLAVRRLGAREPWVVDAYVDGLRIDGDEGVAAQWRSAMHVFNENHRHLSFMELTLRRDDVAEQAELFLAPGRFDPFIEHRFLVRPSQ